MAVPVENALRQLSIKEQNLINDYKEPRFYGDKHRQEGFDVDALDAQVEEHKIRKAAENESDKKYEIDSNVRYKEEELKDVKDKSDRRSAGEQIDNYRHLYQSKELSREFDLNDPKSLRKQLPMCTGDNDPRIQSKGSLLRFDSEDYDGQRKRNEANKLRQILEEQIREKEELKAREKLANKNWRNASVIENDFNLKATELKEKNRYEDIKKIQAYNLIAADAKHASERNQSSSDIYSCFRTSFSDSQITAAVKSNVNPNIDCSKEQLSEIQDTEKEKVKENEDADDYYSNLGGITGRQDKGTAANVESKKRDESVRIREINKKLAIEQRQRRQDLDRADHDCYPSDDFFAQFSKNSK